MNRNTPALQQVRANGLDFAYLELGQGPLVLCLHGFPDTAWSFVPLMRELAAAGYRVVAPFMRGYAPSGLAPDGDYGLLSLGRDVLALIEALGEPRAHVIGHDWGSAAASLATALQPQRLHKLVLVSVPHLRHFLLRARLRQWRRSRYMAFFQLRGIPERRVVAQDFAWLRGLIREWSPGWDFSAADFAPLKENFSQPERLRAALAYYRAMPRGLLSGATWRLLNAPLQVPTLMLHGAQDGCIGPEMFAGQERHFAAGYRCLRIEDAGHFVQAEQPARMARSILDFLT